MLAENVLATVTCEVFYVMMKALSTVAKMSSASLIGSLIQTIGCLNDVC